jgi:hypothetical protein
MSPNLYMCCLNRNQPALFDQRDQEVNFQASYLCAQFQDRVDIRFLKLFAERTCMLQSL